MPEPGQHLVGGHDVAELLDDVFQRARCSSSDSAAQQSSTSTTLKSSIMASRAVDFAADVGLGARDQNGVDPHAAQHALERRRARDRARCSGSSARVWSAGPVTSPVQTLCFSAARLSSVFSRTSSATMVLKNSSQSLLPPIRLLACSTQITGTPSSRSSAVKPLIGSTMPREAGTSAGLPGAQKRVLHVDHDQRGAPGIEPVEQMIAAAPLQHAIDDLLTHRHGMLCDSARPGLTPSEPGEVADRPDHAVEAHGHAILAPIAAATPAGADDRACRCAQRRSRRRASPRQALRSPPGFAPFSIGESVQCSKLLNTNGISRQWQDSKPGRRLPVELVDVGRLSLVGARFRHPQAADAKHRVAHQVAEQRRIGARGAHPADFVAVGPVTGL